MDRQVTVGSSVGLHARPATVFCKAAAAQSVAVTIGMDGRPAVDARSILSVLGLGIGAGDEVTLTAPDGSDGAAALDALTALLAEDLDAH